MEFRYCPNCRKDTGHRRVLGWGTFFIVIVTSGFWLLAIPFYPKRCIVCGHGNEPSSISKLSNYSYLPSNEKKWYKKWWAIIIFIIVGANLLGRSANIGKKNSVNEQMNEPINESKRTNKQADLQTMYIAESRNWTSYDNGFFYDKDNIRKVNENIYELLTLIWKEKGYSTIEVRINCETNELFYGTCIIFDEKFTPVFTDKTEKWQGGQPNGEQDKKLVESVCNYISSLDR